MSKTNLIFAVAMLLITVRAFAQLRLKASEENPSVGQAVVLQIDGDFGTNASLNWTLVSGNGDFVGATIDTKKVVFRPSKAGDLVKIACEIRMPGEIQTAARELRIAGQAPTAPAPAPTPQEPPKEAKTPSQPASTGPIEQWQLPEGALAILTDSSMIPAGFMADAIPDKDGHRFAFLNMGTRQECHGNHGCFRIEVTSGGKEGWAGFAWQDVPEGASANWGDHPGRNLSHANYQSLWFWARGQGDSDFTPRAQFKSGGNVIPKFSASNPATYIVSTAMLELPNKWKPYCLDLRKQNLSNVVSPFTVVVSSAYNPKDRPVIVFIDDVHFSQRQCTESR